MQNKPELVFVYHHLGLGDHFVCNGLVRHILSVLSPLRLYLPTKQHNMTTVSSMYCDDRRVVCLPVRTDSDVPVLPELRLQPAIFQVGFSKCRDDWDSSPPRKRRGCQGHPDQRRNRTPWHEGS